MQADTIPTEQSQLAGATLLEHNLFTNDVVYLEAALNLRPVPTKLLPLVPLFCRRALHSLLFAFSSIKARHYDCLSLFSKSGKEYNWI